LHVKGLLRLGGTRFAAPNLVSQDFYMNSSMGRFMFLGQKVDNQALALTQHEDLMGIMTRRQGAGFVISSDRSASDAPTNRPPKGRPTESYEVWTDSGWSAVMSEAKTFGTLDDADDYVRINFARVTGLLPAAQKPSVRRPAKPSTPVPDVTATI
jgi:hypothetical protein